MTFAVAALALASPPPLRVETDLCDYEVEFDEKRMSRERVEAFLRLWEGSDGCWMGEMWDASLGVGEAPPAREGG